MNNHEIIFDLETTGLPKKGSHYTDTKNWPRIVCFSWYEYRNNKLFSQENHIVCPIDYRIPIESTNIHGVSNDMALNNGVPLEFVLNKFFNNIYDNTLLIAHNMSFDINVLKAELYRLKNNIFLDKLNNTKTLCTKLKTMKYCNIKFANSNRIKWPKLEELYFKLFNKPMKNAHNCEADVMNLSKCYFKLKQLDIINSI